MTSFLCRSIQWTLVLSAALFVVGFAGSVGSGAESVNLRVRVGEEWYEGKALNWSSRSVNLLTRDGFLRRIKPSEARDYQRLAGPFRGYPPNEMRGRLLREFGKRFEVSGTGHYLVVHPVGQRDRWARRFEDLYRSFVHYFSTRGLQPTAPQFPLVAVVFSDRAQFASYARSTGANLPPGVIGYYSPLSNRILLYDLTASHPGRNWFDNADTIIHEATHQSAYNTGVHTRFASTPRWVAEGLATMFEARGVWDAHNHRDRSSRINRGRLTDFQDYLKQRKTGSLHDFIVSDGKFRYDMGAAYAEAWALSFYLSETQPQKYAQYLRRVAARKPFTNYDAKARWTDFSAVFGRNITMFEAHYLRFFKSLR